MSHTENPYLILGIDKDASNDDIKRAWRKLALKYHPDKNLKNNTCVKNDILFKNINNAYQILNDPEKLKKFGQNFLPEEHYIFAHFETYFKDKLKTEQKEFFSNSLERI